MQNFKFAVGSKIKVIDKSSEFFRFRGCIKEMPAKDISTGELVSDWCLCHLTKSPTKSAENITVKIKFCQLDTIQKKYLDIEHIREESIDLGNGIKRNSNVGAFEKGDYIQISEKCDGANASISYNEDEGKLEV